MSKPAVAQDGGAFSIREEAVPYVVTSELERALKAFPVETGVCNSTILGDLPADFVWSILDESGEVIGNIWAHRHKVLGGELRTFISFSVFDGWRGKGAARLALPMVERELAKKGVLRISTQVNSNKGTTGLRVRRWLFSSGYNLIRSEVLSKYAGLADEALMEQYSGALMFEKGLDR